MIFFFNAFKSKAVFFNNKKFSPQESHICVINCLDICLGTVLLRKCLSSENFMTFKKEKPLGITLYLFLSESMMQKVKISNQVLFHFSPQIKYSVSALVGLKYE